jgi:DNA modification methylase
VREPTGANLRNYWILGPDPNAYGHPAAFPRELARRCILLGSREGDTILDPFGGCGTTGFAAQELNRESILIEINPSYVEMDRTRKAKKTSEQKVLIDPSFVEMGKVQTKNAKKIIKTESS